MNEMSQLCVRCEEFSLLRFASTCFEPLAIRVKSVFIRGSPAFNLYCFRVESLQILVENQNMKKNIFRVFAIFLFLFGFSKVYASLITSEKFSYTIDMPEGFEITDMEADETTVIFKSKYLECYSLVKVWPESKFSSSKEALTDTFSRLSARSDFSECIWRRQRCAIASFSSAKLLDENAKGWAVCVPLPQKRGYLSILTYASEKFEADLQQVMISILDSVMIDAGSFREAGIITSTFFPRKSPKKIKLEIGGQKIETQIDSDDAEASQFVIDREFAVFKFYAENNLPEMFDAWTRFYRLIAKDTMERVKRPSFDIYSALWTQAEQNDAQNPSAALSQILLTWVQNFPYARKSAGADNADIESLPAILEGGPSDCDGRSLLLMCILRNCGIDSCFFVSAQYSHALLGVHLPDKQGQTIEVQEGNGTKDYLVGETTAKGVTLGMMPSDMQDRKNWIPVELP